MTRSHTGKSYSDTDSSNHQTSAVTYGYDGATLSCPTPNGWDNSGVPDNQIGRRSSMCFAAGSMTWTYDPMGRINRDNYRFINLVPPYNSSDVITNNPSFPVPTISTDMFYTYYLNGDTHGYIYPGNIPNYQFSTSEGSAGRVTSAGDQIAPWNLTYATYAPDGQLATGLVGWANSLTCGIEYNGSQLSNTYNNRLQPVLISATTTATTNPQCPTSATPIINLTYNFNLGNGTTGSDNGNVMQIANGKDSNRTQNFIYDSLNRIEQAYTSGPNWGETYGTVATGPGVAPSPSSQGIDAWGNLAHRSGVTGKSSYEPLDCPANVQNQLNTCFTYDAAGNLIANGTTTYTYDAENRLIGTNGYSYIYDGDGQRIEKCIEGATPGTCATSGTGTFYWKQVDGQQLRKVILVATGRQPMDNPWQNFVPRRSAERGCALLLCRPPKINERCNRQFGQH